MRHFIAAVTLLLLVGCAGSHPACQYKTEVGLAADSMDDARAMLAKLRDDLHAQGFRVDARPGQLTARRDWLYEPTADLAQRRESYSIVVEAAARESEFRISINGREEQLVSPNMWERRWTPWAAKSAGEMRDQVDAVASLVRFEYPRASQH